VSVLLNAGADVNHEDMSGATKTIPDDNYLPPMPSLLLGRAAGCDACSARRHASIHQHPTRIIEYFSQSEDAE
jgi:hypothetical protein